MMIHMADMNYNKLVAQILGIVLVLIGILGFFTSPILGIFAVNTLHNIIHLLTGGILLVGAYMAGGRNARMTNMVLGFVYLLVALVGFLNVESINHLVGNGANDGGVVIADAVLHALLAVVLLVVSFAMKQDTMMSKPAM